jgi:hypothetical protein
VRGKETFSPDLSQQQLVIHSTIPSSHDLQNLLKPVLEQALKNEMTDLKRSVMRHVVYALDL